MMWLDFSRVTMIDRWTVALLPKCSQCYSSWPRSSSIPDTGDVVDPVEHKPAVDSLKFLDTTLVYILNPVRNPKNPRASQIQICPWFVG
jgi:hypothetical protein